MDLQLNNHVSIVTGASRGLGAAAARSIVEEGGKVVIAARSIKPLAELAEEFGDRGFATQCDMRNRQAVEDLVQVAINQFGRLDSVVNNAGIAPAGRLIETDLSVIDEILDVNFVAPLVLSRAAARYFVEEKIPGSIINIASTSAIKGKATLAVYSASKGALLRLSEALADEWARHRIRVNVIAPGAFTTDAQAAVTGNEELLKSRLRKIPTRRMGEPSEIGPLVCYLASSTSDFVTGSCFVIDGGEVAKL